MNGKPYTIMMLKRTKHTIYVLTIPWQMVGHLICHVIGPLQNPRKHKANMPVTIKPSDIAAKLFETEIYEESIANGAELLQFSCPKEHENVKNGRIFHSSFDKLSKEDSIFECGNGL
jgi:hypothetical protein